MRVGLSASSYKVPRKPRLKPTGTVKPADPGRRVGAKWWFGGIYPYQIRQAPQVSTGWGPGGKRMERKAGWAGWICA